MPLIQGKSKKSFQKNLKTELGAGKPLDQSLAISYNVQRTNKRKKMAAGGIAQDQEPVNPKKNPTLDSRYEGDNNSGMPARKPDDHRLPKEEYMAGDMQGYAEGGEVCSHCEGRGHMMPPTEQEPDGDTEEYGDHRAGSIAEAILAKQSFRRLAEGGKIELDDEEDPFDHGEGISRYQEEGPGTRIKHNINTRDYNAGDDRQISEQPEDSNETGDQREEDSENKNDRVSAIRAKMKSGRR